MWDPVGKIITCTLHLYVSCKNYKLWGVPFWRNICCFKTSFPGCVILLPLVFNIVPLYDMSDLKIMFPYFQHSVTINLFLLNMETLFSEKFVII